VSDQRRDTGSSRGPEQAHGAFMDLPAGASAQPLQGIGELTRALLDATTIDGVLQRITIAARYLVAVPTWSASRCASRTGSTTPR
jgi:hypothetical protein